MQTRWKQRLNLNKVLLVSLVSVMEKLENEQCKLKSELNIWLSFIKDASKTV